MTDEQFEIFMDKQEVLNRGYARNMGEWWLLVDDKWNDLKSIISGSRPVLLKKAVQAKQKRDAKMLWLVFQKSWEALPDSRSIHRIPGFGRLCDLCSDFPFDEE